MNKFYLKALISLVSLITLNLNGGLKPVLANLPNSLEFAQQIPTPNPTAQTAFKAGMQLLNLGTAESRQQAIEKFQEAAQLFQSNNNRAEEARSLQMIGLVYFSLSEYEKTVEYYTQTLEILNTLNQPASVAYLQVSLGMAYLNLNQSSEAITILEQALTTFRQLEDSTGIANSLSLMAQVYYKTGETERAIHTFNQVLELQKAKNDPEGQVETLQSLALIYIELGQLQKGIDVLNQAKALNPLSETLTEITDLINRIANASKSRPEEIMSLEELNQQFSNFLREGSKVNAATTLIAIGILNSNQGDYQQGLEAYYQALKLYQELKLQDGEASTLTNIGGTYQILGQYQESLDAYDQALQLQRQLGDRAGQAETLKSMAEIYNLLGSYQRSLEAFNQAFNLYKFLQNRFGEGQALNGIATIYRLKKDYQKATESAQKSLNIFQSENQTLGQVLALSTLVRIYEATQDYSQALEAANQILTLGKTVNDSWLIASGNAFLARVYLAMAEPQKALEPAQQAATEFETLGQRAALGPTLDNLGRIYVALKQPQNALEIYNKALSLWQLLGDRAGEVNTLYNLSRLQREQGNLIEAKTQIETALNITEDLRNNVTSQELRQSYFATVQDYYEFYIDLLMELHQQQPQKGFDGLALEASERARARSLLELLAEANADIRQGVNPKLLQQEQAFQQQINALEARRVQLLSDPKNSTQLTVLEQQRQTLYQQYQTVLDQIRSQSPRYAALTQPQPLTLSDIQSQILDDKTLLLEYFVGKNRSYVWAVTKNSITSYQLPKKADLDNAVRSFMTALFSKNRFGQIQETASNLSHLILTPVAAQLGQNRLIIVADGALQYIPFAALPLPQTDQPLMVNHEIVYLPSASTLARLRQDIKNRQPATKTVAIIADPVFSNDDERVSENRGKTALTPEVQSISRAARDVGIEWTRLPGTRREAEVIQALVPETERTTFFDFQARREQVTNPRLGDYRIIHFATHGFANSEQPELSGVVMSLVDENGNPSNGFLRLHDIYNLNLPVELVVLSACQTGLGKAIRGEGLVGLTRGFMYAGSPRVITSLWSVDDEGTALLMSIFYEKMLKENLSPSAALRAAQLQLWQQEKWRSPYYWAAFSLQGEWR